MPPRLESRPDDETSLTDVLDRIGEAAQGEGMSINDLLEAVEDRSLGMVLTALGLVASMPVIGGIPGVSVLVAAGVLISVGQSITGRGHLRLPGAVGRRSISAKRARAAIERTRPWTERVDGYLRPRLEFLVAGRAERIAIALTACILALSMFPLAVVPWGVTAPAVGMTAFGLALIARDGLLAALGYALGGATLYLILAFV